MTLEELRQYILGALDKAIGIRDEQRMMANTAKRVGGDLVDIVEILRTLFSDYLDQAVKTDSDVLHNSVTAKSLTEEDNPDNENTVSPRLVETGGGYLGDMDNVSDEANTAMRGSMLIKDEDAWVPVYPTYSPVASHDNLLMPVFNTLTREWLYITVPSGGVVPPVSGGFPYSFPVVLS
jgi:hypothetical protein